MINWQWLDVCQSAWRYSKWKGFIFALYKICLSFNWRALDLWSLMVGCFRRLLATVLEGIIRQ